MNSVPLYSVHTRPGWQRIGAELVKCIYCPDHGCFWCTHGLTEPLGSRVIMISRNGRQFSFSSSIVVSMFGCAVFIALNISNIGVRQFAMSNVSSTYLLYNVSSSMNGWSLSSRLTMNISTMIGPNGLPMATPSICLYWVTWNRKSSFSVHKCINGSNSVTGIPIGMLLLMI